MFVPATPSFLPKSTIGKIDRIIDYVPALSSAKSLIDIFLKCVALPVLSRTPLKYSHTFQNLRFHYKQKSFIRCVVLLVPVLGNMLVFIIDRKRHQKALSSPSVAKHDFSSASYADQADWKKALAAVKEDHTMFKHVGRNLSKDPLFVAAAVKVNPLILDGVKATGVQKLVVLARFFNDAELVKILKTALKEETGSSSRNPLALPADKAQDGKDLFAKLPNDMIKEISSHGLNGELQGLFGVDRALNGALYEKTKVGLGEIIKFLSANIDHSEQSSASTALEELSLIAKELQDNSQKNPAPYLSEKVLKQRLVKALSPIGSKLLMALHEQSLGEKKITPFEDIFYVAKLLY